MDWRYYCLLQYGWDDAGVQGASPDLVEGACQCFFAFYQEDGRHTIRSCNRVHLEFTDGSLQVSWGEGNVGQTLVVLDVILEEFGGVMHNL